MWHHTEKMTKDIEHMLENQDFSWELEVLGDYDGIMANISKIQYLPLERLHFKSANESFHDIIDAFQNLSPNLQSLRMTNSNINMKAIGAIINLIPNLISLELVRCDIQSNSLVQLFDAIEKSQLHTLKLDNVVIGNCGIIALINCIKSARLDKLFISGCCGCNALESVIGAVAQSSVQTLILHEITFDAKTMIAISNCIECAVLTKLSLTGCKFVNNKIDMIMESIKKSSVQILDLRFSRTDNIMKHVQNSPITKLDFGSSSIDYSIEEIVTIASAVKANNKLRMLGLNFVPIDDKTISIICDMIENSTLTAIRLIGCRLLCSHITKICASVKGSSIVHLDLSFNPFKSESIMAICDLLENSQLEKLKLAKSCLSDEFVEMLLVSIEGSKLVNFNVDHNYNLSKNIEERILYVMREQNIIQMGLIKQCM